MKLNLTCIVCPLGCNITVTLNNGEIEKIEGNTCPRGEQYAVAECTAPTRTVTTTVMSTKGVPVPVKTNQPIPKDKIFECMKAINSAVIDTPVKIGDVALSDIFGADIVVTANVN